MLRKEDAATRERPTRARELAMRDLCPQRHVLKASELTMASPGPLIIEAPGSANLSLSSHSRDQPEDTRG